MTRVHMSLAYDSLCDQPDLEFISKINPSTIDNSIVKTYSMRQCGNVTKQ